MLQIDGHIHLVSIQVLIGRRVVVVAHGGSFAVVGPCLNLGDNVGIQIDLAAATTEDKSVPKRCSKSPLFRCN
jgi:hypothetical protein